MKHVDVIEVRIWGKQVGAVAQDPGLGAYVFEYADSWRRTGIALSPFMMPLDRADGRFAFPALDPTPSIACPACLPTHCPTISATS